MWSILQKLILKGMSLNKLDVGTKKWDGKKKRISQALRMLAEVHGLSEEEVMRVTEFFTPNASQVRRMRGADNVLPVALSEEDDSAVPHTIEVVGYKALHLDSSVKVSIPVGLRPETFQLVQILRTRGIPLGHNGPLLDDITAYNLLRYGENREGNESSLYDLVDSRNEKWSTRSKVTRRLIHALEILYASDRNVQLAHPDSNEVVALKQGGGYYAFKRDQERLLHRITSTSVRREISETPRLQPEEATSIAVKLANGHREFRDVLVRGHLYLVEDVVGEFVGKGVPDDDLINAGVIGMLDAIVEISYWNQNEPLDAYLRERIRQEVNGLCNDNGRYLGKTIPLSKPVGNERNGVAENFESLLKDQRVDTEMQVERSLQNDALRSSLDVLTHNERAVIFYRLGIKDDNPKSIEEIALLLHIDVNEVAALEDGTLSKLRHVLQEWE